MKAAPFTLVASLVVCPAFAWEAASLRTEHWPFEIAIDPEFRRLAGERLANEVAPLLETGPKVRTIEGRWLVIEECPPHACDVAAAFVTVDTMSGTVTAWMSTTGKGGVNVMTAPAPTEVKTPQEIKTMHEAWLSRLR